MAMAHRGRLNVLANIIGKPPQDIFREFEDIDPELYRGGGDVKYHLGYYRRLRHFDGQQGPPLALLQSQPPGVRQSGGRGPDAGQAGPRRRHRAASGAWPILIHGDAAFAGEGIVQETLNSEPVARLRDGRHGARGRSTTRSASPPRRSEARSTPLLPPTWPRC